MVERRSKTRRGTATRDSITPVRRKKQPYEAGRPDSGTSPPLPRSNGTPRQQSHRHEEPSAPAQSHGDRLRQRNAQIAARKEAEERANRPLSGCLAPNAVNSGYGEAKIDCLTALEKTQEEGTTEFEWWSNDSRAWLYSSEAAAKVGFIRSIMELTGRSYSSVWHVLDRSAGLPGAQGRPGDVRIITGYHLDTGPALGFQLTARGRRYLSMARSGELAERRARRRARRQALGRMAS